MPNSGLLARSGHYPKVQMAPEKFADCCQSTSRFLSRRTEAGRRVRGPRRAVREGSILLRLWHVVATAQSPIMESGSAIIGSVDPNSFLTAVIALGPLTTVATTGPDVTCPTSLLQKCLPTCT